MTLKYENSTWITSDGHTHSEQELYTASCVMGKEWKYDDDFYYFFQNLYGNDLGFCVSAIDRINQFVEDNRRTF